MHLPWLFVCIELESWEFLLVEIVRVDSALSRFLSSRSWSRNKSGGWPSLGGTGNFMFFPFTGEFLYIVGLKDKMVVLIFKPSFFVCFLCSLHKLIFSVMSGRFPVFQGLT